MTSIHPGRLLLAILTVAVLAACDPDRDPAPAASRPATIDSAPVLPPLRMSREARFVTGKEKQTEPGYYTTVITDQQQPPGEMEQAQAELIRIPGQTKKPQDYGTTGDDIRFLTLAGTKVRLSQSKLDTGGYDRQLDWVDGDNRYVLLAGPYYAADDSVYGPSEEDLTWLAERIIRTS